MHIETQRVLCSQMNQPFKRVNLINDSVIKSVTCRHLTVVLVSFLKYNFSYLNEYFLNIL